MENQMATTSKTKEIVVRIPEELAREVKIAWVKKNDDIPNYSFLAQKAFQLMKEDLKK